MAAKKDAEKYVNATRQTFPVLSCVPAMVIARGMSNNIDCINNFLNNRVEKDIFETHINQILTKASIIWEVTINDSVLIQNL